MKIITLFIFVCLGSLAMEPEGYQNVLNNIVREKHSLNHRLAILEDQIVDVFTPHPVRVKLQQECDALDEALNAIIVAEQTLIVKIRNQNERRNPYELRCYLK